MYTEIAAGGGKVAALEIMARFPQFLIFGAFAIAFGPQYAVGQSAPPLSGTIDGQPIPPPVLRSSHSLAVAYFEQRHGHAPAGPVDEREVVTIMQNNECQSLRVQIGRVAREEAARDLGITVTRQDLDAASQLLHVGDPAQEVAKLHDRSALLLRALSAVDKGEPADQVYQQMLASRGIGKQEWAGVLRSGQSPKSRELIANGLKATPEAYARDVARIEHSFAESRKLDAAIDHQIAASDPRFSVLLKQWSAGAPGQAHSMLSKDREYMDQKVAAWWKPRLSKIKVTLSDPSLIKACQLTELTGSEAMRGRY